MELAKGNKKSVSGQLLALSIGLVILSGAIARESIVYEGDPIASYETFLGVSGRVWSVGSVTYYGNIGEDSGYSNNSLHINLINNPGTLPNRYVGVFAEDVSDVIKNNVLVIEDTAHSSGGTHFFGAYSMAINGSSFSTNNEVEINDGVLGAAIISGFESVAGYDSLAKGNVVNIYGGTYTHSSVNIAGARADTRSINYSGSFITPDAVNMQAIGNTVNINGGDFSAVNLFELWDGFSGSQSYSAVQNYDVSNNIVNINQIDDSPNTFSVNGGVVNYNIKSADTISDPIDFKTIINTNQISIDDVAITSSNLKVYVGRVYASTAAPTSIIGGGDIDIKINDNTINHY